MRRRQVTCMQEDMWVAGWPDGSGPATASRSHLEELPGRMRLTWGPACQWTSRRHESIAMRDGRPITGAAA
jgi:hypothetical protein